MLGWIKLHRTIQDWEWYTDVNTCHLFIHILLKATHQDYEWRGIKVKTGECICGRKELSLNSGLSEQQVRTSLEKLKNTKNVTIKTTNKYSIISIVNWEKYQDSNQQDNQQVTNKQPTNNHIQEHNNKITKELSVEKDKTKKSITLENFMKYSFPDEQIPIDWGKEAFKITNWEDDAILLEWEKFKDYWKAANNNTKKDWLATWRNWLRNNRDRKYG
jgi:hypothetical protein